MREGLCQEGRCVPHCNVLDAFEIMQNTGVLVFLGNKLLGLFGLVENISHECEYHHVISEELDAVMKVFCIADFQRGKTPLVKSVISDGCLVVI